MTKKGIFYAFSLHRNGSHDFVSMLFLHYAKPILNETCNTYMPICIDLFNFLVVLGTMIFTLSDTYLKVSFLSIHELKM